jgi:signal transduction histidine kinase
VSAALAWLGWGLAFAALGAGGLAQRELSRRMELVARAAHELRGPLTAARLGLHLLAPGRGVAAERLAAVDLELRRAGLALEDLHAARTGRRARDRFESVDLGDVLRDAVAAWRAAAAARRRELRLEGCPAGIAVRGDRLRLAQACGNLVANALEHGAGTVRVSARGADAGVRIEVADDGPGLPAPVADLTRRPRAGRGRRGRGLAIAAEIAARHGGRLDAAPAASGGRVVLELPVAGEDAPARPASG